MNNLIEKYKLRENLSLELDFSPEEFSNLFNEWIEPERTFFLDEYYRNRKKYWGKIDSKTFEIREKRNFFSFRPRTSNAFGKIENKNGKTNLNIFIKSYNWMISIASLVMLFFFLFGIIIVIVNEVYFPIFIILTIALIWYSFIYFRLRYDLKVFRTELIHIINKLNKKNALQQRV